MTIPKAFEEVPLYSSEDQHQIDDLRRAVEKAASASPSPLRLGDDINVVSAAEAYDEFVAEAAERSVKARVENIPGHQWRAFVAEHTPRPDNDDDADWGFNFHTLGEAVVPLSVVSIGGNPPAEGEIADLREGHFAAIYEAVRKVNTGRGPNPKDSISATLRKTSPETSESPARLG